MRYGDGWLAMPHLMANELAVSLDHVPQHFPVKAKYVIHIFANGGPSHVDTFDYKPELEKFDGKTAPTGNLKTERPTGNVMKSPLQV